MYLEGKKKKMQEQKKEKDICLRWSMTISSRHKTEKKESECIAGYIRNALLGEVFTTPKPGLVDLWDSGAHTDMNWITFQKSTDAVTPYLTQMYEAGYEFSGEPGQDSLEQLFCMIRDIGRKAEKAMYRATAGVNTHKGMIFSMGILCAAYGYCKGRKARGQKILVNDILDTAKQMTGRVLTEELKTLEEQRVPQTNGERLLSESGERGIRGEVLDGFPVVRNVAYPELSEAMKQKEMDPAICQSQVNLQVLLSIMKNLRDTNILNRGQESGLVWVQQEAECILRLGGAFSDAGMDRIIHMNQECIRRNLSSGGAADQLALTLLLWQIEHGREIPVYCPKCTSEKTCR